MSNPFTALDHVQLAMPKGEEVAARRFYCDVLGMTEIPKPSILAKRGGCWFKSGNVQIHLGVEADFRPAKKAHPALRCADFAAITAKLRQAGIELTPDDAVPGTTRCYIHDIFGNRIEIIES
jgi:catechol 2,3-dioxygenase-like lactoylglutathione lyase family enzyme